MAEDQKPIEEYFARLTTGDVDIEKVQKTFSTPSFMLQMDDDLSSKVKDFEKFAPVFFYEVGSYRQTPHTISGNNFSNASINFSLLRVILHNDIWTSKIYSRMEDNLEIKEVTLVRLIDVDKRNLKSRERKWQQVTIRSVVEIGDYILLGMDYKKFEGNEHAFGQDNKALGNTAFKFNVTTSTTETPKGK